MDFISYFKEDLKVLFLDTKAIAFLVCYWSELGDKVGMRYLASTFSGHTSPDHVQEMVMDVLESSNVSIENLANLSTDGQNINKGLHQKLNQ